MNNSSDENDFFKKHGRKKSMVWEYFTIETVAENCSRACCNKCKQSFAYMKGSKTSGTSHLKRHIASRNCSGSKHNMENDQPSTSSASRTNISVDGTNRPRKRLREEASVLANIYLDGHSCSREYAKMVIQHDYPLNMAEHSGFIDFAKTICPQFSVTSVGTVEEQIMTIYFREKQKLMNLVNGIPGCINLTMDLWTSNQSLDYVLLTGYFIDCNWKLQRRIFDFVQVPFHDSFCKAVASCLTDWNSRGNLFTFTLARSHEANEIDREKIRGLLSIENSLILKGQLLINSCYARVLSSIVQDALLSMRGTIEKVRQSVKYVKTSEGVEDRFTNLKGKLKVPSSKNLVMDDLMKWDSTYEMLMAASEVKEVFFCLDTCDPDYKSTPTMEEWGQVDILCKYLKLFYDAAKVLTSPICPTSNIFFHEVWKIYFKLMHASPDIFERNLTKSLLEKFTKYWDDCNLVLAAAVVMDPRYKMKHVQISFSRIYGEDADTWVKIVHEGLNDLYLEYKVQSLPTPTFLVGDDELLVKSEMHEEEDILVCNDDFFSDFDIYVSAGIMGGGHMKSELGQYLEEPNLAGDKEFDVLGWWRQNESKYPSLSKMACNILSIPVSTLPPDSVFDTSERKLDSYRSSLRPGMLQAIICAKDWLQYD